MSPTVAIAGVGDVVPRKGESVGYLELQAEVAKRAIDDAGLSPADVDGVVFTRSGYPLPKSVFPSTFAEHLGLAPAWMELAPHGGAQMASILWRAAGAIRGGLASVVLMVSADNRDSRLGRGDVVSRIAEQNMEPEFEVPYGPMFSTNFALMASQYLHRYGRTEADFAHLAVAQRRWARLHPAARMTKELGVDDVLGSRMISSPLRLLDFCLVTDGGAAAVMVAGDRAADLRPDPVYLLGYGDCAESQNITGLGDLVEPALYRRATATAFGMAGITAADVDLVYPYDPTTSFALWGLEQMGFAEPGTAGDLAAEGALGPGGSLPTNTHGGLLSYAHPGVAGAPLGIVEAVRQLRGEGGDRQVPGAEVAVTSAIGGFLACGVNVLGGPSTRSGKR